MELSLSHLLRATSKFIAKNRIISRCNQEPLDHRPPPLFSFAKLLYMHDRAYPVKCSLSLCFWDIDFIHTLHSRELFSILHSDYISTRKEREREQLRVAEKEAHDYCYAYGVPDDKTK